MSSKRLFFKRIINSWREQWGVIHSVLDWTVILYMAIPSIIFGCLFYKDLWENVHLYWSKELPAMMIIILLLLVSFMGNFRTFIMNADLLFLIQRPKTLKTLKMLGFWYTFIQKLLTVSCLMVIVLPILKGIYDLSPQEIVDIAVYVMASSLVFLTIKKVMNQGIVKWICLAVILTVSIVIYPFVPFYMSMLFTIVIIVFHMLYIVSKKHWFMREIEIEELEKVKYMKLILNFSTEVEKVPSYHSKKPLILWRQSGKIFKKRNQQNGLLEFLIKGFFRDRTLLFTYLQLTFLTCSAILILPLWLKWVVLILFILFMNVWMNALYHKLLASPFFSVVSTNEDVELEVSIRFKRLFVSPSVIVTGVLTILVTIL
ncbi:ABC transporter permease [Bacillus sp. AK128]